MALTRYAAPRWARSRDRVLAALSTLLPILAHEHAVIVDVRERQAAGGRKAGEIIRHRFKLLPPRAHGQAFTDTRTATNPTTPVTARPHANNRADLATRQTIIAAQNANKGNARLSDAPKLSDNKAG